MSEPVPELDELEERLLDASLLGRFEEELNRAVAQLDGSADELDSFAALRYQVLLFDLALVSTTDRSIQLSTGQGVLAGTIQAGGDAWTVALTASRLAELERLAIETEAGVDVLELFAYAPEPGARGFGLSQIEAAGLRALDAGSDSRPFERLLHGVGASGAAYRLEVLRKHRSARLGGAPARTPRPERALAYRRIAIAGGHAQLRVTAASLLGRYGVTIAQIPSSRESVRRERDVIQLLRGCDAVVLLVRQITHSTSDQVRRAAERLGIPVIYSNALSALAIERQLMGMPD